MGRILRLTALFLTLYGMFSPTPAAGEQVHSTRLSGEQVHSTRLSGGPIRFAHLSAADGMSSDNTRCAIRDSRGFVWVGTEMGLNRYDGTRVKQYFRKDTGLDSDYVFALQEDAEGNIWVGTSGGVSVYDYETDSFFRPPLHSGGHLDDIISSFAVSPSGEIWFGGETLPGLYSFDGLTRTLVAHPFDVGKSCPKYMTFIDEGRLAVACRGDDLYIYNVRKDTGRRFDSDCFRGLHLSGVIVVGDKLYVLTYVKGLCAVDLASKTVSTLLRFPRFQRPVRFSYDGSRYIWIATTDGLVRYDVITSEVQEFRKGDGLSNLPCDFIMSTFCSPDGIVVATESMGICISSRNFDIFRTAEECKALSMDVGEDGKVYVSTEDKGLMEYDYRTHRLRKSAFALPGDRTGVLCFDSAGCLWVSLYGGVARIDTRTGQVRRFIFNDPLQNPYGIMWCRPFTNSAGDVFLSSTGGLFRYDSQRGSFRRLISADKFISSGNGYIVEDGDGVLWRSSYASGVFSFRFDADSICETRHFTPENSDVPTMTSSVIVDSEDRIWVLGRDHVVVLYDREDSVFVKFDSGRVPSFPDVPFKSVVEGSDGLIWISTSGGLVRFDPSAESATTYTTMDGLPDNFFTGPSLSLPNGNLLLATSSGLVEFNPFEIPAPRPVTEVVSFEAGGERLETAENINLVREIRLPLKSNSFSVVLATPGTAFCGSLSYFLEGLDKSPGYVSSDKTVRYFNVPAGRYSLHIEGHDDISVRIIPPFWSSAVGISLIVILSVLSAGALAAALLVRKSRREKAEAKERAMEEKLGFLSGFVALEQFDVTASDEEFLRRLDRCVTKHLSDENFSVKELESELAMGHTTLNRKMASLLNTTPNEYIRTKRLAVALHLLRRGGITPSEVCYRVGFSSPSYFAKCFKDKYGYLPSKVE